MKIDKEELSVITRKLEILMQEHPNLRSSVFITEVEEGIQAFPMFDNSYKYTTLIEKSKIRLRLIWCLLKYSVEHLHTIILDKSIRDDIVKNLPEAAQKLDSFIKFNLK